jgi:ATP-dependent RNA helicase DDX18/HAS1
LTSSRETIIALKKWIQKQFSLEVVVLTPGTGNNTEIENLRKKHSVLISCPARFFHHLKNSKLIDVKVFSTCLIDEVDLILSSFSSNFLEFSKNFSNFETLQLFTENSSNVENFLKNFQELPQITRKSTSEVLKAEVKFVKVDIDKKFLLLHTFLFKNKGKKIVVVFNTSNEVIFFSDLLKILQISTFSTHSLKNSEKVEEVHSKFLQLANGILLTTVETSSNMRNIAKDFLIAFDSDQAGLRPCIESLSSEKGKVLLFTSEEELTTLQQNFPESSEMKVKNNQIWNIQEKIEKIVKKNYEMHKKAREGYKNYILSTKLRQFHSIAKNFGLEKAFLVNNLI